MKIEPHYSSINSIKFWGLINNINNKTIKDILYQEGCLLQELEEKVLKDLQNVMEK